MSKDPKDNNTENFAEQAHKLKLKMKRKKDAKLKSPGLDKPELNPQEVKELTLRLLKKKKMTLDKKMDLRKEGPSLTFGGIPILTPEMILELEARQKRKEQMQMELVAKMQEELKLALEKKPKDTPQPRSKKKIKPGWI